MKKIVFSSIAAISLSFLPGVADQQVHAASNLPSAGTQQVSAEEVSINNVGTTVFVQENYSSNQGSKIFVTRNKSGTTYRGYLYKNYDESGGSLHVYQGYLYRYDVPLPIT